MVIFFIYNVILYIIHYIYLFYILIAFRGKTFRKDYACIYEIRSFVDCPISVFTATVTPTILQQVKKLTGVRNDALKTIVISPDRYELKSISILREFMPLIVLQFYTERNP
jgi:hypothetical protein